MSKRFKCNNINRWIFLLTSIGCHLLIFIAMPDYRHALEQAPEKLLSIIEIKDNISGCQTMKNCGKEGESQQRVMSGKKCVCAPLAKEVKRKEFTKELSEPENIIRISELTENTDKPSPEKIIEDRIVAPNIPADVKAAYSADYIMHNEVKSSSGFNIETPVKSGVEINSSGLKAGFGKKAINLAMLGINENSGNGNSSGMGTGCAVAGSGGIGSGGDNIGGDVLIDGEYFDEEMLRYQNFIKTMIYEKCKKSYPRMAQRQGIQGKVMVSFLITGNGHLRDVKLVNSSSHDILDQAAVKTIYNCSPFKPLPAKNSKNNLLIKMALSYVLE